MLPNWKGEEEEEETTERERPVTEDMWEENSEREEGEFRSNSRVSPVRVSSTVRIDDSSLKDVLIFERIEPSVKEQAKFDLWLNFGFKGSKVAPVESSRRAKVRSLGKEEPRSRDTLCKESGEKPFMTKRCSAVGGVHCNSERCESTCL